jgi:hypothetical protein
MTDQQLDAWFWILVGFASGLIAIGVPALSAVAYSSWRRRDREATTRGPIVVPIKSDGLS